MVQILLELAQIPSSNDEIIHGFLMEDHLDQRKMPFFFRQNHLFVRSHVVFPEHQTHLNIFQHSQP